MERSLRLVASKWSLSPAPDTWHLSSSGVALKGKYILANSPISLTLMNEMYNVNIFLMICLQRYCKWLYYRNLLRIYRLVMKKRRTVLNDSRDRYFHLSANSLGKDMNSSTASPQLYVKKQNIVSPITLVGNQFTIERNWNRLRIKIFCLISHESK